MVDVLWQSFSWVQSFGQSVRKSLYGDKTAGDG